MLVPLILLEPVILPVLYLEPYSTQMEILVLLVPLILLDHVILHVLHKVFIVLLLLLLLVVLPLPLTHVLLAELEPYHVHKLPPLLLLQV